MVLRYALRRNVLFDVVYDYRRVLVSVLLLVGVLQDLWINNHALHEEEITFFDNGQELLLYTNLGTYACNYTEYCNIKFITSVYNKDGLVLEYPFDYESDTSRCLYDLFELRKAEPERWLYKLDNIYSKYGIDTVNKVREGINL